MAESTLGIGLRAGFAREAIVTAPTWPAAAPAALATLLPVVNLQPNDGIEKISFTSLPDSGLSGFDIRSIAPTIGVPMQAVYQGIEPLWACALGYMAKRLGGSVLPEALATGVFRHLYECDARLGTTEAWDATADGFQPGELLTGQRKVRRGTFAVDMGGSIWEWLSTMIQAVTLQCEPGGCTCTMECVAHSLTRTSTVNTAATLRALLPLTAPRVLWSDLTFRIAPYSMSSPLTMGDMLRCSAWTLRLENGLAASPGPRTGTAPEEYERADAQMPRVTLTCVLPRHTSDLWQTRWSTNTPFMADAKFTSERVIAPGYPYRLNLYLPSCLVTNAQLEINGPQLPPDVLQFVAVIPAARPAGFPLTQHLSVLQVEVVSGTSQHPLL